MVTDTRVLALAHSKDTMSWEVFVFVILMGMPPRPPVPLTILPQLSEVHYRAKLTTCDAWHREITLRADYSFVFVNSGESGEDYGAGADGSSEANQRGQTRRNKEVASDREPER